IILSGVTVSMLFSPLMALPSGGKFTHGTSGSINKPNDKTMNIIGNGKNSVIQWGGGFSIGKGESVNFGGTDKNYLNIAHGTSKSTIEGVLNAGGNNVFLINPNGVIIEKSGSIINAKNFMASTATLSDDDFNTFKNLSFENPQAFSPKIKPNSGNVVNLGKINATNSITLQGNKIVLEADFDKGSLNKIEANELNLKGNEVYADVGTTKVEKVNIEANNGTLYLSATGYYYDPKRKYDEFNNVKLDKTYNQYISIGSDLDWWHFAKGWNEKDDFRNNVVGDTFKLTNDIDFGASEGKNYANYCIDGLGCTSMIVGRTYDSAFRKTFDGQGYTLSNINIDTTVGEIKDKPLYVGIFGLASVASFSNINIDYMNGGIRHKVDGTDRDNYIYAGGFIGDAYNSKFYNMSLKNISNIYVEGSRDYVSAGGFAGEIKKGDFNRILIQDIGDIFGNLNSIGSAHAGGFAGFVYEGIYKNISMQNVKSIKVKSSDEAHAGGFAGFVYGTFSNIYLDKLGAISASSEFSEHGLTSIGGFFGSTASGTSVDHIYIYFDEGVEFTSQGAKENNIGKFVGKVIGSGIFSNIHIYHHENDLNNATADKSYWGNTDDKIQIHTYNNNNKDETYKDFENKINSIKDPSSPSITKPTEKDYLSAQEAKEQQATLTQDDLYESIVKDIFNSLNEHSYAIDLNTLQAFLEAYDKLSDTKSKEDFLANFLLDKSKYSEKERENLARSLVQSMDFILAYSKNDAKDSKFESGVEATFENLKDEAGKKHSDAKEQGKALRAYVESLINPVNSIKNNNGNIANNNTKIKELEKKYNSLVNSINKGLLDENELLIAQKRLGEIVANIEDLLGENKELKTTNDILLAQIESSHKDNFRTYGVSSSISETPTLSAVILNPGTNNGNDNNGDTSNGSDASQVVSSLQKQNSAKLGNAAVVEEEEKNEVDETSLMQKGKICIVSDNSKTMNPCIVGGL
ncbi:filamentous hemagglutinin N-terminal domain-containing protein, partial [Campylobacter lari]|nr:filamentous hemagglutinin N-terminal domain-containing protein [Campylobacter lari]